MRSPGGRPTTSGSTPCSRRSPTSAPPPARRASRCARHARTWPRALATRAITISSGHGRSGHLTVGAADYNGSARVGRNEGRRHSVAALRGTACRLPALGGSEPCQFRGGRAKRPVRGVVGAGGQAERARAAWCAARWRCAAGRCPAGTRRSDGSRSGPGLAVIMRSSAYSRAAAPRSPRRRRPWLGSPPGSGPRPGTRAGGRQATGRYDFPLGVRGRAPVMSMRPAGAADPAIGRPGAWHAAGSRSSRAHGRSPARAIRQRGSRPGRA